jgi:hypothetical protein
MFVACLALLGLVFVASCSSDSSSSTDGADATAQADARSDDDADGNKTDDGGSKASGNVPEGFPDIPLPEFTKADVVKSGAGESPGWSVLFTVDPTLETDGDRILTDYAAQLEAAGYQIEGDTTDPSIEANKGDTLITFHSSMDGTITIGVFES